MSEYISVAEAAVKLGLSHQQVLNRVKRGRIPGTKVGWIWMIKESDLEAKPKTKTKK